MASRPSEHGDVRSGQDGYTPQHHLPSFTTPSPPSVIPRDPSSMPYPFRLSYASDMSPIHALPVELLTRIFQLGVDSEPLPDDRIQEQPTFEVSISHVCRHWRQVALHTPHLWTTIHLRTKSHMLRANIYLARNTRLPLDIYVDTCSEDVYANRKHLLFRPDFLPVFDILIPHILRWRELHLKVADLGCKAFARQVLHNCGSAPALRTLQLWHVQNWQTPERLFTAIGPPPVIVFAGSLPSLKHIVLQGVNLPWLNSPFLRNLTSIEYALHSDDVRMPFHLWREMLASSPALERLSLHYSGPRARASGASPPDGIEWWGADPPGPDNAPAPGYVPPPAMEPVHLPRLHEIQLHDLESDYLIAVFKSIHAPNVRALYLELDTEDQDFSPFVDFLSSASPACTDGRSCPSCSHLHLNGNSHQPQANGSVGAGAKCVRSTQRSRPRFPRLETLSVSALECSAASWKALLESARALTRLEVDFVPMDESAFGMLFGTVRAEKSRPGTDQSPKLKANGVQDEDRARKDKGKGKARADADADECHDCEDKEEAKDDDEDEDGYDEDEDGYDEVPILPALQQLRCAGIPSREVARLAEHRRAFGAQFQFRIRRWEVEEAFRDEDGVGFERELERLSARWQEAERRREEREGRVREPWRWDEPIEKVVWYREEDEDEGEYDDDDDEGEGEEEVAETAEEDGDGDGDGDGDEDGDAEDD